MDFKKVAVATALLCAGSAAMAQSSQYEGTYMGLGYTSLSGKIASFDGDFGLVSAKAGYRFNRYMALEGTLGSGMQDDSYITSTGDRVTMKVDNYIGASGVLILPMTSRFSLLAKAGYGRLGASFEQNSQKNSAGSSSLSYGLGAEYNNRSIGLRAEYESLNRGDNLDFNGVTVTGFLIF